MTIAFTLSAPLIIMFLVAVGIAGMIVIAHIFARPLDIFTYFLGIGFGLVFVCIALGITIGKYFL